MNPEAIFKRTALWSLPLFSSLSAVADRQSPGRLAAAAVCTEKGCSPEAKLLPPAKGSQWAQIRWAVTLKIRLSLGQLDICLVTFRATCFFREILGGRNSTSYLLLLLLYFWWVSSSSLMLVGVKSQKPQYQRSTILSICHVGWFGWHGSQSLCSLWSRPMSRPMLALGLMEV